MMNDDEKRQVYQKAITLWKDLQVVMGMEESGELTVAIAKYVRKPNKETLDAVADEFADVEIMKEQFEIMFGDEFKMNIELQKQQKLARLKKRIEQAEKTMKKPLTKEKWTVQPLYNNINCPFLKASHCKFLETPDSRVLCDKDMCPIKEENEFDSEFDDL